MLNAFIKFLKARKDAHLAAFPRKPLDEILEFLRFTKVAPYIKKHARLLDVGAGDGNFLRYLNGHLDYAVGIDTRLREAVALPTYRLIRGAFPDDFLATETAFDVITMLAVAEHIPMSAFPDVAEVCWKYLKPDGRLIITVQHPRVEGLLNLLKSIKIVEGFSMHEHYGFDPECLPKIFYRLKLLKRERWGFGCNNLFIFKKTE